MDGTERFMKRFNIPKPSQKQEPDVSAFRDYEELCLSFIKFFEEFSGRKVNQAKAVENLVYFFDQGFELDDLIAHVKHQQRIDFYLTNPDRFTINTLFPVKDPDRCNTVWDQLSFHQSKRNKSEKVSVQSNLLLKCGHQGDSSDGSCTYCISAGDERSIMIYPYSAAVPEDKKDLAQHFMRQNGESLLDYSRRTFEKRVEINAAYGQKITEDHRELLNFAT